ncbi:Chaperone protein EcpD precursor [compost metagenome]|uniref:fimbrial biogenesis chaperone n=1 Tax=Achromobacter sp. Root83 TaxID=1736602 RepID=UPI000AC2ADB9|nr:fimbria/pilus periplasmic chaperone [Achromobacter sp. Root83]
MWRILHKTAAVAGIALILALHGGNAVASIVITGTRVIYPENQREVSVSLTNNGQSPALVQAWLDRGDPNASPETIDVPFMITPTMFRLDASRGQVIRLIYSKEPQPADKETLYWLNVLEIPPRAAGDQPSANKLQLAIRTRIKVMFRPVGLAGRPEESPAKVTWSVVPAPEGKGYLLKGTNPTPYFVNLSRVSIQTDGKTYPAGAGHIAPGDSQVFSLHALPKVPNAGATVLYTALNDYGAGVDASAIVDTVQR